MKKIEIKHIFEDIYYTQLDNGLKVYFYINDNVHNNYVTFTTKYGSVDNEFILENGKKIKMPNGIAHFLEHKVFVCENDPQPEDYFARSGGVCNAYTTFKNTTYLFSSVDNIYDNVCYLLDFVQNIYLTDENVETEKGIITQEINMCNDRPSDLLYDKIRMNTIENNSFKESIIGTVSDVNSITREMLLECYNTFYHPGNMFLVVTGNFDKDKMLDAIRKNQDGKTFSEYLDVKREKYKESDKVVCDYEVVPCNTNIPKMAYSIKINTSDFKMDKRKLSIYMFVIFNLLFGDTSDFDEKMKDRKIITNTLYYNLLNIDSHFIVTLSNALNDYEELIKEIDKKFKNIKFSESELSRKKKVLISNEVFSYENIEMVNEMIIDNIIFDGNICDNVIDLINSLNIEELNEIVRKIDFSNKSIVVLKKDCNK